MDISGYLGKTLRIDLSREETSIEELDQSFIEKWIGGVGFGARYLYEEMSTMNANFSGIRMFDDCLGTCRIASTDPKLQLECLNAVTGWDLTLEDSFTIGRRIINQLRMFNFRHGMKKEDERPSKRYGSVPVDGPARGKDIMEKWEWMLENYYTRMGWDPKTGKPLPETLKNLGLEELSKDL